MGNELKIVLIVIAIYLVLGVQNLVNTSVFLIPYEVNPLVIFSVSIISLVRGFKNSSHIYIKAIFCVGILFYAFFSSRTLNILHNRFQYDLFLDILNNDFSALIAILGFYIAMFILNVKMRSKSFLFYFSLVLLLSSFIGALVNLEYLQIIGFTFYVISLIGLTKFEIDNGKYNAFLPMIYQLFLFVILENTYFILIKYC